MTFRPRPDFSHKWGRIPKEEVANWQKLVEIAFIPDRHTRHGVCYHQICNRYQPTTRAVATYEQTHPVRAAHRFVAGRQHRLCPVRNSAAGHHLDGLLQRPEHLEFHALPGGEHLREALFHKGFFADLDLIPGAQEGIQSLLDDGYEIFFVTAAQEFRNSLEDKYDWLLQYFPNVPWRNFVFCGDKSIIGTDYLIDDHAFNLRTFSGKGLLFTAPHNLSETEFTRVNNWSEVLAFFEQEKLSHAANR